MIHRGNWPPRLSALLVLLALLHGCGLDVRAPLVGSAGSLRMEDALSAYVRAQLPGSLGVTLISSQQWRGGQGILFRFQTADARGQPHEHLGVAFAARSGLLGWRVSRIYTVERLPTARARRIELYVGNGLLPGSPRFYTRADGRVNVGGARSVLITYTDGEDIARELVDGYFLDLHEGRTEVASIAALDADGRVIGNPLRR